MKQEPKKLVDGFMQVTNKDESVLFGSYKPIKSIKGLKEVLQSFTGGTTKVTIKDQNGVEFVREYELDADEIADLAVKALNTRVRNYVAGMNNKTTSQKALKDQLVQKALAKLGYDKLSAENIDEVLNALL